MTARAPKVVRFADPLVRRLLLLGVPMGPDTLLTVRGRRSGRPRTTMVAVLEMDGRRWVVAAYGEVNWVRNLRAAGEARLRTGRRWVPVQAVELTPDEREEFFSDRLVPYVRRLPLIWRWLTLLIWWLGARQILEDPVAASRLRPVFELHPAQATS
jgi:deazaflavin-dependent oxidoreductase (nitroreductase family)